MLAPGRHALFAGITAHLCAFVVAPPDCWIVDVRLLAESDPNGAARTHLLT
jgi:hypothetical protein